MIGEVHSGSSFRGLTHYLLHGSKTTAAKTPEWVELRNLLTRDPQGVFVEMTATAQDSPRVASPVYHVILSPAPEDHLTREQWTALADRVLTELGLGEHQALVALHTDTDVPHLHLAVNRVHPGTFRAWPTWRSKTRLRQILSSIEAEWGLRRVRGRFGTPELATDLDSPPVSRPLVAQARHRASEPQLLAWRKSLNPELRDARSWTDLAARLERHGVRLEARGRGLVATDGSIYAKASSLDRGFSRSRLEWRFGRPFAEWRSDLRHFDAAARLYPRYDLLDPENSRAQAARETLRTTGARLGWRHLEELRRPFSPSVGALAVAHEHRERLARTAGDRPVWDRLIERHVGPALERSTSWAEVEARLRLHGAWLHVDPKRPGLAVSDGANSTPLSALGPGLDSAALERRLGSWRTWRRSRQAVLRAAYRVQRLEQTAPAAELRSRRLAGILQDHELRIEGYRALHVQLEDAENHLRELLAPRLPRRDRERWLDLHVRNLLRQPPDKLRDYLAALRPGRRPWSRQRGVPDQLLDTATTYRRLAAEVGRRSAPARSAARRLPRLRLRAHQIDPRRARQSAQTRPRPRGPSSRALRSPIGHRPCASTRLEHRPRPAPSPLGQLPSPSRSPLAPLPRPSPGPRHHALAPARPYPLRLSSPRPRALDCNSKVAICTTTFSLGRPAPPASPPGGPPHLPPRRPVRRPPGAPRSRPAASQDRGALTQCSRARCRPALGAPPRSSGASPAAFGSYSTIAEWSAEPPSEGSPLSPRSPRAVRGSESAQELAGPLGSPQRVVSGSSVRRGRSFRGSRGAISGQRLSRWSRECPRIRLAGAGGRSRAPKRPSLGLPGPRWSPHVGPRRCRRRRSSDRRRPPPSLASSLPPSPTAPTLARKSMVGPRPGPSLAASGPSLAPSRHSGAKDDLSELECL